MFNALHGTPGEDGTIQGLLDLMQIPYTHSGLETSVIAIDKELTKMVLVPHGIRMPKGKVVESRSLYEGDPMARPYVLKPVNEGSSVGVAIVTDEGNYGHPISARAEGPWLHFERLLAEPFIQGRELTVAVLGDEAMCVTELKPKVQGFYDFDAKYTDGLTEHVCPAEVPANIAQEMMDMALAAHRLLGCKGASRSRFPLGRCAGRGRRLPARGQHPAGHDAPEPGARAGAAEGHQLWRAGRADHRRSACRPPRPGG